MWRALGFDSNARGESNSATAPSSSTCARRGLHAESSYKMFGSLRSNTQQTPHQNAIAVHDRLQAMRDDDHGAVHQRAEHRVAYQSICAIERREVKRKTW